MNNLKLHKLIAEYFAVEEHMLEGVTIFTDDLGADSMDMVELHHEIEDAFNIEFEIEAMVNCKTVADVDRVLEVVDNGGAGK